MKLNRRFLGAAAALVSLQILSAGDITGKITIKGTPPPDQVISIMDAICGKVHPTKKTRLYVVSEKGELADTFIYVKDGLTGKEFPVPEKPKLIDQVGCEYVPYVSGLMVNQVLLVRNSDKGIMHNVHPIPAVKGNNESNIAQLAGSKDLKYTFAKEESFLRFKCDVHPWMYSYVTVLSHPFYSVSATDGTFKIENLPAGKYTIEAKHRKAGTKTMEVEVPATGAKEANIEFEVKP